MDGPGEDFGRYHVSGRLGHGEGSRLYLAEQRGVGGFVKVVVIKHVLPHLADAAQFQEMFLTEAKIAATLDHPNIVSTFELGEVDGKYFTCMEYLPGENLATILNRCNSDNPIPYEIAAMLAQQCAKGLHYAHETCDDSGKFIGLAHGDVNPTNIFVSYHGVAKLLNFGVVNDELSHKSLPGVFQGKFAYCAPEQVDGLDIDQRTDVFSLGIVLWECLTGSRLFNSGTDTRTIDAIRSLNVRPPSALRSNIPWQLDAIVLRALSRDPQLRYQTAQEMANALDGFLIGRKEPRTANVVGQWLESLFGAERALLKKAIAHGSSTAKNLARLEELDRDEPAAVGAAVVGGGQPNAKPRALWSTNLAPGETKGLVQDTVRSTPGLGSPELSATGDFPATAIPSTTATHEGFPAARLTDPPPGRLPVKALAAMVVAALVALAAVIGAGAGRERSQDQSSQTSPRPPTSTLEISSQPPGAQVFVDGDPSGLKTPATLGELRSGRSVEVRLDLMGHRSVRRRVDLQAGESHKLAFVLESATGVVKIEGLPRRAIVYVDDAPVDGRQPFSVPVGTHRLRVEDGTELLFSRTIDVQADGLTVKIRSGGQP